MLYRYKGVRGKIASVFLVLGVLVTAWSLRGIRRIEVSFVIRTRQPQCVSSLNFQLGEYHRYNRQSRNDLPPWRVLIYPGDYRVEGTLRCLSGKLVSMRGWDILLEEDSTIPLEVVATCSCDNLGT